MRGLPQPPRSLRLLLIPSISEKFCASVCVLVPLPAASPLQQRAQAKTRCCAGSRRPSREGPGHQALAPRLTSPLLVRLVESLCQVQLSSL